MKQFIIILIFSLFIPLSANCGAIYQYSVQKVIELNGGQLFLPQNNSNSKDIYFIKSGLMGEDAILHSLSAVAYSIISGRQLVGSRVVKGHRHHDLLFILLVASDSLFLNVYKEKNLIQSVYITLATDAAFDDVSFQSDNSGNVLLKIGKILYLFVFDELYELNKILLISENCINLKLFEYTNKTIFAFIEDSEEHCFLRLIDSDGIVFHTQIVPYSEIISLQQFNNYLTILFGSTTNNNSLINTFELNSKQLTNSLWVRAKPNFAIYSNQSILYYLTYDDGSYKLIADNSATNSSDIRKMNIPKELVEPIHFQLFDEFLLVLFKNAIITVNYDLSIRSFDFLPFGKWFDRITSAEYIDNQLVLTTDHFSVVVVESINEFWKINTLFNKFWQYIVPIIFLLIILYIAKKYRNEKRLVQTLLDMPATGFLYIIDKNGQLIEGNEFGRELLGLKKNIPMKRQFRYYFKIDNVLPVYDFYEEIENNNKTESKKVNIIISNEQKEFLCYAVPINNIAGGNRGIILSGIDITEQLERKRLTNWAQLAHDMQTNLSTIRLNTEHLEADDNESNKSRRKKILHQVNVLMNRIRDVITVGRSDTLDLSIVSSADICNEVRMEFDEVVFPNVNFHLDIKDFSFKCDKQKLIRALRNAVENGIRSLHSHQGEIILSCYLSQRNIIFSIKDNGKGMDDDTRKKFLTPYFTTGGKTGGSGIGTMIMLRVAEIHGGHLNISSELGKGTEIQFVLPNVRNDLSVLS